MRALYATVGVALFIAGSGWAALGTVDPPGSPPTRRPICRRRLALDTAWDATATRRPTTA